MSNPYASFCQDFYINMRLNTQLNLPHNRETVLHFFERIQKEFPGMTQFRKYDNGDFNLEEDRSSGSYRWARLESRRLVSGFVNPPTLDDALKLHQFLLELAPYHLGISPLELEHLEVLYGFDLNYRGNHDDVVIESLMSDSPLVCLAEEPDARPIDVQPTIAVSLSEDCRLQARVEILTRTDNYQVRTGDYSDEEISVYLTVRRYWSDRPKEPMEKIFADLFERADSLSASRVVPRILRPLSSAIASRS
ncbi:MAG TPA: hypothetical protein VHP11_08050 [Tepidisphaeraceae bacterium]|nr:hypothetical protein [Tepidisphaeraceae bacterium]